IVQQLDVAERVADQQQRLVPDPGGKEVAGIFHLAFMADINPGGAEDFFKLQIENSRIRIEAPVHATGSDQSCDFLGVHERLSLRLLNGASPYCTPVSPGKAATDRYLCRVPLRRNKR